MNKILKEVPDFIPTWQEHLEYWGQEEAGLCNDLSEFSSFVVKHIASFDISKKESIFQLAEQLLTSGDDAVQNAVATCFLENILNAVSAGRISSNDFTDFLGDSSKKYCQAWDSFTGIKTENL